MDDMDIESLNDGVGSSGVAKDRLKSFIERVERLEEEKKAISDDMKEIFAEAQTQQLVRSDISSADMASVYWAAWEGALIKMKMSADIKPVKKIMELMIETLLKK